MPQNSLASLRACAKPVVSCKAVLYSTTLCAETTSTTVCALALCSVLLPQHFHGTRGPAALDGAQVPQDGAGGVCRQLARRHEEPGEGGCGDGTARALLSRKNSLLLPRCCL